MIWSLLSCHGLAVPCCLSLLSVCMPRGHGAAETSQDHTGPCACSQQHLCPGDTRKHSQDDLLKLRSVTLAGANKGEGKRAGNGEPTSIAKRTRRSAQEAGGDAAKAVTSPCSEAHSQVSQAPCFSAPKTHNAASLESGVLRAAGQTIERLFWL